MLIKKYLKVLSVFSLLSTTYCFGEDITADIQYILNTPKNCSFKNIASKRLIKCLKDEMNSPRTICLYTNSILEDSITSFFNKNKIDADLSPEKELCEHCANKDSRDCLQHLLYYAAYTRKKIILLRKKSYTFNLHINEYEFNLGLVDNFFKFIRYIHEHPELNIQIGENLKNHLNNLVLNYCSSKEIELIEKCFKYIIDQNNKKLDQKEKTSESNVDNSQDSWQKINILLSSILNKFECEMILFKNSFDKENKNEGDNKDLEEVKEKLKQAKSIITRELGIIYS